MPHTVKYDFHGKSPALPPDSLILVTGVTGLLGGHVADKLLAAGYRVRGVTRSASRGQWTVSHFTSEYGADRYSLAEISSPREVSAYTEALQGVSGVVHVASDLSFSDKYEDVVPPTIAHTRTVLEASGGQKSVLRFVYTSSSAALLVQTPGVHKRITAALWNDEAVAAAQKTDPKPDAYTIYAASKTLGEKEVWKYVKEHPHGFVANTVNPNMNHGPLVHKEQNASTSGFPDLIWEAKEVNESHLAVPSQWFIDVEDAALLHVAALLDPEIRDERILGFAEPFTWRKFLDTWKRIAPERDWGEAKVTEVADCMEVENERGADLLRRFTVDGAPVKGWTSIEDSLRHKLASDRKQGKK